MMGFSSSGFRVSGCGRVAPQPARFGGQAAPLVNGARRLLMAQGVLADVTIRAPLGWLATAVALLCLLALPLRAATNAVPTVLLVSGAPGEAEFATNFVEQVTLWQQAIETAGARKLEVGHTAGSTNDLAELKQLLQAEPRDGLAELWIVLIGHGTFDGKEGRFNLRGPDLAASELAELLKPFTRPVAVINTTAASSPFLKPLAGTNRVVITATRSGYETSFARFGLEFARAIGSPVADLDQDGQTSLLESFLHASAQVVDSYRTQNRLASEHALVDDNGDGMGTPADWFRGLRAVKKASDKQALDGLRAHQWHLVRSEAESRLTPEQRAKRDQLELAVAAWRDRKAEFPEAEYFARLEVMLRDLAQIYRESKAGGPAANP